MDEIEVSLQEVAGILGVSDRTVQRWHDEGFPRHGQGRGARYPVAAVVAWIRRRDREALEREISSSPIPDLDEARARKEMALARLREYELAEKEGSVVTLDFMEAEVSAILFALRGVLLATPTKYAPALVGCRTLAEAQARLDDMVRELMAQMSDPAAPPPPEMAA